MVMPIRPTATNTDRLPRLKRIPEARPAIVSFLINLLAKKNNGIPITKMERLKDISNKRNVFALSIDELEDWIKTHCA